MIDRFSSDNGNGSSTADSLFASYIDRLVGGEPIDVDQVQAQHPELGAELIEQLRSFCELADESNDSQHPRKAGRLRYPPRSWTRRNGDRVRGMAEFSQASSCLEAVANRDGGEFKNSDSLHP